MKKIYLDTSTLFIYFKDCMKPISGPAEIPISIKKLREHKPNRISNAEYWTSCIAKYETFKNLKHDFNINFFQFERMWLHLIKYLEIKYIGKKDVVQILLDETLEKYLNKYTFRSGLADIIQIILAKEMSANMFSNDKKMREDWKATSS